MKSNQRLLIGIVLGLIIGLFFTLVYLQIIPIHLGLIVNLLIYTFSAVVICIIIFVLFGEKIFNHFIGDKFKSEEVDGNVSSLISEIIDKNKIIDKENVLRILNFLKFYVIKIYARSWAFKIITSLLFGATGLLGYVLLQNQNSLIAKQNEKIDIQNQLIESERRSSSIFLLGNLMQEVNKELSYDNNLTKDLSPQLVGQIIAMSKSLKPYKYMASNEILTQYISPERGQLLIFLLESDINTLAIDKIMRNGSFDFMEVTNYTFENDTLHNFNFENSVFTNVEFLQCELRSGSFDNSIFIGNLTINRSAVSNVLFNYGVGDGEFHERLEILNNSDVNNMQFHSYCQYVEIENSKTSNLSLPNISDIQISNSELEMIGIQIAPHLISGFPIGNAVNMKNTTLQGGTIHSRIENATMIVEEVKLNKVDIIGFSEYRSYYSVWFNAYNYEYRHRLNNLDNKNKMSIDLVHSFYYGRDKDFSDLSNYSKVTKSNYENMYIDSLIEHEFFTYSKNIKNDADSIYLYLKEKIRKEKFK